MTRRTHHLLSPLTHVGSDLEQIFSGVFDRDFGFRETRRAADQWLPAIDISEQDDVYRIEAELPGFGLDDINITIEGRKLVISGNKTVAATSQSEDRADSEDTADPETATHHVRERRSGSFLRTVTLPVNVDPTKADAQMHNGVLTLSVPKAEAARQHKIEIRSH